MEPGPQALWNYRSHLESGIKELEKVRSHDSQASRSSSGTVYIIPVVFHILHMYGQENISDAQVIDAVNILNRDFRKRNSDTANIVPEFKGIAADCEIEFRLARKDPNGDCTNGIDRIATPLTEGANDDAKLNQWNPKKYLNIWVARSLERSGVAGYSYYPSTAQMAPQIDGIMMLSDYIGSIGTGNPYTSRTLTHEVGHYLDLPHTWGSTNSPGVACGDDGVGDTPVTRGFQFCSVNNSAICNPPVKENVQNYMEYSFCTRMFTTGQKNRMRNALNSIIAFRNNLSTSSNLAETGTDGTPQADCAPKSDFNATRFSCAGAYVYLYDQSWRGTALSYKWLLPGSDTPESYVKDPVARYYTPGSYSVTLITSNAEGSDTLTKTNYIHSIPSPSTNYLPFSESFEDDLYKSKGWIVYEDTSDNVRWKRTTAAGYYSSSSLLLDVFNRTRPGAIHSLITPAFDLTTSLSPALEFKTAYATRAASSTDAFRVYYSLNCGSSWIPVVSSMSSADLSAGMLFTSYSPYVTDWKYHNFSIPSFAISVRTQFLFEFTVGENGNNFFLDDINIASTVTSVNGSSNQAATVVVHPNPAHHSSRVSFTLRERQLVTLKIYDLLGKEAVSLLNPTALAPGSYSYDTPPLLPGVYFVKLSAGSAPLISKLVIE
jgi:PKD repeat protein